MKRHSITIKLIIFTVVTICLIIISTFALYKFSYLMVEKEFSKMTEASFSQISNQVNVYLNESADLIKIFSYSTSIQQYLSAEDAKYRYEQFKEIDSLYITTKSIKTYLKDLLLADRNGNILSIGGEVYNSQVLYGALSRNESLKLSSIGNISRYHNATIDGNNNLVVSCPVYERGPNGVRMTVGFVAFLLEMNPLTKLMDSLRITKSAQILLFDKTWKYIVGTSGGINIFNHVKKDFNNGHKTVTDGNATYAVYKSVLQSDDFNFVCLVPKSEIYSYGSLMEKYTVIAIILQAFIALIMGGYISLSFGIPIKKMQNTIIKVRQGHVDERVKLKDKSEIGMLAENFDTMMDSIKQLTETTISDQSRMYELELKKNEMELIALQSQLNPHFLYNTLACIRSIAITNGQDEISSITKALAKIYNYILRSPDMVTVAEEIEIIKNFISIYEIRIGPRLSTRIEVEEELLNKPIMKLTLQPLIENAVEHGIAPQIGGGEIKLTCKQKGHYMQFVVYDNGKGMSKEKLDQLIDMAQREETENCENRSNFGLYNTITRLKLLYSKRFKFYCDSSPGSGTTITIEIPLI